MGEHRELDEIDARDIMSVALDLDVSLDDFDTVVREVIDGLLAPAFARGDGDVACMMELILDSAKDRIKVLQNFLG